ncbi:putative ABC transport system permease protein [Granulicella rosea]|uniref:Putative ABC transport system permease protein n=1 Tax=Granulicella rosea TaxID=474952 RepID=A0A239LEK7_9BACT|nr:ABC transporter permease [Granulicella rosea]SNT28069.1 putative ABC transport system permease protein [Granulicella rosea]
MLGKSLKIALAALRRNRLRTGLALLGMTIGVAAVLTMFALGTGAEESVSGEVRASGTTLIYVRAGNFANQDIEARTPAGLGFASTLVPADAEAIHKLKGVDHVSPVLRVRTWVEHTTQPDPDRQFTAVMGVDAGYEKMFDWELEKGRFFKSSAVKDQEQVVILGSNLRDQLFPGEDPVGKQVVIKGAVFTVKGCFSSGDEDQASMAVVPYTTLQKLTGSPGLTQITLTSERAGDSSAVAQQLGPMLRQRHHLEGGTPDDFTVRTQAVEALSKGLTSSVAAFIAANMPQMDQTNLEEMSGTLSRAGQTMTALLAAIATISLIVGGIGIMNIMLVSVTERTREIGIRRALGARSRDVLSQFLVEALTLGVAGGVCGIVLGFAASLVITYVLEWPATVSAGAVALSFGVAAATGVFFGFYPARRASRLNPIDALRFE